MNYLIWNLLAGAVGLALTVRWGYIQWTMGD